MARWARATVGTALLLAVGVITTPGTAGAAPQSPCSGDFCVTMDLATNDAANPTQPTTTAGQPTNLTLQFTDTSATVATDESRWLAKVSAQLGTSSSKAMYVADPASLPLGSFLAGSAATVASCAPGTDGTGYATSCPAGFGTGHVKVVPILGSPSIKSAFFGIQSITTGAAGAITATVSIFVPTESSSLIGTTATFPMTYSPPTATQGPTLTLDVRAQIIPSPPDQPSDFSMNTLTLHLNGLVSPTVAFIRQSLLCTAITSTLTVPARGAFSVSAPFTQTITGCPNPPTLVSVAPVAGQTTGFTFTMGAPTAAVAGRSASLEWVFGDGAKANTGATTTHTYPKATPVVALVTVVDSAGARSSTLQLRIGGSAIRAKQKEGDLLKGSVTDQDTGAGVAGQQVAAYRCPGRSTPVSGCQQLGQPTTTASHGGFRLAIPEVKKAGFVVVSTPGGGTTSPTTPARFGDSRAVDVLPQPVVTLHLSKKQARPGSRIVLSGKVSPGKRGKTVRLQGFIRGKWRAVAKATVGDRGRYATTYVVHAAGTKLKLRALVPGTAATLQATSPVKKLTILR